MIKDYLEKLSEELILARKCIFSHRWTKWKREEVNMVDSEGNTLRYVKSYQSKECLHCGLNQIRDLFL